MHITKSQQVSIPIKNINLLSYQKVNKPISLLFLQSFGTIKVHVVDIRNIIV